MRTRSISIVPLTALDVLTTGLLIGLLGSAGSAAAQDLVTNSGFATSLSGWQTSDGIVAWSASDASGSSTSGSATGGSNAASAACPSALFQQIYGIQPNRSYNIAAKMRIPAGQGSGDGQVNFYWFDAQGAYLGTYDALITSTTGPWQSLSKQVSSPSGAAQVQVQLRTCHTAGTPFTLSWDDLSVVDPSCTLTCNATVSGTATLNSPLSFSGTASPGGTCTGAPSFQWNFGDGGTSTQQNPTHSYSALGFFTWTLTVSAPGAAGCLTSGNVAITNTSPSSPTLIVEDLALNPLNPATVYAATLGGLQKSTDSGATWSPSNSGLSDVQLLSLAVNPLAPSTSFVGTNGNGISKSTNSGGTWSQASSGLPVNVGVVSLAIDPISPFRLYAGTSSDSVYRTTDSGVSWVRSSNGLINHNTTSSGAFISPAIAIDPVTPTTLYAGSFYGGVFKSTDGAGSWNDAGFDYGVPYGVSALAINPSSPSTLYAGTYVGGVFRSTNAGASWATVNFGLSPKVIALAMNPATPATLYAGTDGDGVFKSTDAGSTWIAGNAGLANLRVLSLAVNPTSPSTIYAGTFGGGVFKSTNAGGTWSPLSFTSALSATVSGTTTICAGQATNIQAALTGTPPWFVGWSDGINQTGVTSSPAVRSVSPGSNTTYSVTTVTDANGSTAGTGSATITVKPSPAQPSITAPVGANPGQTGLTAAVLPHAGSTYAWGISNGVITAGNGTSSITFTAGSAGSITLTVIESNAGCSSPQANASVPVGGCSTPGKPTLSSSASSVPSGLSFSVSWSAATNLGTAGSYLVETSVDSFASIKEARTTSATTAIIPTTIAASDAVLFVRVRAKQDCATEGLNSNVVSITVKGSPAGFVFTKAGPSFTAVQNSAPPPADTVTLRNVGGQSGIATFSTTSTFFTISPTTLSLAPGATGSVTVRTTAQALSALNRYSGLLVVTGGVSPLSTPVSLAVVPAAGAASGAKARATVGTLTFQAPAGQNPPAQTLIVNVTGGQGPVYLSSVIGPGGSWLEISTELSSPVPASGQITLTVSVNRTKRTPQDGVPPLRTVLRLSPVGSQSVSDSAVVEILDVQLPPIVIGPGPRSIASNGSFLIPVAVKQESGSGGAVFTSDGWLRNQGAATVAADLYFTPENVDGLAGASVRKASVTIPPSNTLRLSDLVASVFGTSGTNGQVEVRSTSISSLSLRTTVDSVTGGDASSRFGTEMPTVTSGSGTGLGDPELVLPGIDDDANYRANVILVETTGSPATAEVTVTGPAGNLIGTLTRLLPAFGKIQINRVVDTASPGARVSSGWASVRVIGGLGRVSAVATVIDNRSGTFSAVLARRTKPVVTPGPGGRPALVGTAAITSNVPYLIPSVARLTGVGDTRFSTRLAIVNPTGSPANLILTYRYIDADDGNLRKTTPPRTLTIAARNTLPGALGNDAIVGLFGITNQSYGSILIEGDSKLIGATATIEAISPSSPSRAPKSAQVNGRFLDEPEIIAIDQVERGFEGAEKSEQFRTNMILLEVDGQPCSVLVRLYAKTGEPLKEQTFSLEGGRYRQINDLFSDQGLDLGVGPFSDVYVTARVVSGSGRVIALATVVDNVSSSPKIFVLSTPGPPDPFKTGF
ncbi:MAG: PKD domain-containing protein [Thermoanaerobaculia bacterium]